ncbi:hypothetical protein LY78DRAFT_87394 [Colletotrichum sublineola]|nr:hypothetical protein LY78DRAFT_87394 [Colletotrichum sublineola]
MAARSNPWGLRVRLHRAEQTMPHHAQNFGQTGVPWAFRNVLIAIATERVGERRQGRTSEKIPSCFKSVSFTTGARFFLSTSIRVRARGLCAGSLQRGHPVSSADYPNSRGKGLGLPFAGVPQGHAHLRKLTVVVHRIRLSRPLYNPRRSDSGPTLGLSSGDRRRKRANKKAGCGTAFVVSRPDGLVRSVHGELFLLSFLPFFPSPIIKKIK